jgi:hypothetical protein
MLRDILNWSEVWALFIPLVITLWKRDQPKYMRPVVLYVWIGFFLHLLANISGEFKYKWNLPHWLHTNNFIYNAIAIVRFFLFAWFFNLLGQDRLVRMKKVLPWLFLVFAVITFSFYDDFFDWNKLSSLVFSVSAGILIFYCIQYYMFFLLDEKIQSLKTQKGFLVVTGLLIYLSINFFIFLFYTTLVSSNTKFAVKIWDVHNIAFVIFSVCIALNLYGSNQRR